MKKKNGLDISEYKSNRVRKVLAFSMVELIFMFVTISCITAAFAPVISKKIRGDEITVVPISKLDLQCDDIDAEHNCKLCDRASNTCYICERTCPNEVDPIVATCKCP